MNAQEQFWRGEFGDEYTERNVGRVENNRWLFEQILGGRRFTSLLEFGAGSGENLWALRRTVSPLALHAVEVNDEAVKELLKKGIPTTQISMLEYRDGGRYDVTMTKGVLIHIAPENLPKAYAALYDNSRQYVLIAEYYNPAPVELSYRGNDSKMWKRDFAGEMMERYPDLKLVDYGFAYHGDPVAPQDDITWFLMEKQS